MRRPFDRLDGMASETCGGPVTRRQHSPLRGRRMALGDRGQTGRRLQLEVTIGNQRCLADRRPWFGKRLSAKARHRLRRPFTHKNLCEFLSLGPRSPAESIHDSRRQRSSRNVTECFFSRWHATNAQPCSRNRAPKSVACSHEGVGILRVLPQRLPVVAEIIADDKIDREVEIERRHRDTGNIEHQYAAHAQTRRPQMTPNELVVKQRMKASGCPPDEDISSSSLML